MIRSATPSDIGAVIALADATGLFQPQELEAFGSMMHDHLDELELDEHPDLDKHPDLDEHPDLHQNSDSQDSQLEGSHRWAVVEGNQPGAVGPVGAAYYAPEPFAEGVWNLYFIGIHPAHQGKGHGTALLSYVEQMLRAEGDRLLLIETSGGDSFERTRMFYRNHGYDEEARIRDFYKAGDDKIIFRKALAL